MNIIQPKKLSETPQFYSGITGYYPNITKGNFRSESSLLELLKVQVIEIQLSEITEVGEEFVGGIGSSVIEYPSDSKIVLPEIMCLEAGPANYILDTIWKDYSSYAELSIESKYMTAIAPARSIKFAVVLYQISYKSKY
jgi:hypothetical protein